VVTGGGRGVGRAIAERLARHGLVIALDRDADALGWTTNRRAIEGLAGDAADEQTLSAAVERASQAGTLAGWVNNAAVFRDAAVHDTPVAELLELVTANLAPAVAGSAAAIRRFLADRTPGAIVNVSSHQGQRPVPGALPYATAKAAIEGLTRALAVDYADAGFVTGAIVPVDGGRSALGHDPEARDVTAGADA
jgi:NAD(P)-dependent dehydrogenase (short-subunit alcohol dehydrogenase family)